MIAERHLRTALPAVVAAMLSLAAYYQANGVNQMLAAGVMGAVAQPPSGRLLDAPPTVMPTGDGVLARNPFDSETGPLLGEARQAAAVTSEGLSAPPATPTAADPACDVGRVVLISAAEDASESFAAIQSRPGETSLLRTGDELDGRTVAVIDWDRVWLRDKDSHCQLKLGAALGAGSATTAVAKAKQGAAKPSRVAPASRSSRRTLAPRLAAKIERVSATEIRVERSLVDELLADPSALNGLARARPPRPGETGVTLLGVRPDSLLGHLGLLDGDRVASVNGFDVSNSGALLQAYGMLGRADNITVQLQRAGKPLSLDIRIH